MCPIVPTFTCGLLRSNFSFAIALFLFLGSKPVLNRFPHRYRIRPYKTNAAKSLAQSILHSRSAGSIGRNQPDTARENARKMRLPVVERLISPLRSGSAELGLHVLLRPAKQFGPQSIRSEHLHKISLTTFSDPELTCNHEP